MIGSGLPSEAQHDHDFISNIGAQDNIGAQGEEPQNKAHAGDATGVSIVLGGGRFGSFAERQQLVEGAPLMRMPLRGSALRAKSFE